MFNFKAGFITIILLSLLSEIAPFEDNFNYPKWASSPEAKLSYWVKKGNVIETKKRLTNYQNNFELFKNNFSFTDSDMKSFIKFAERNDVVYSNDDFQKDEQYIKTRLKAQIARNYWNNNGWYAVLLELDEQYIKAKELLESNYKLPTKY